MTFFKKRCSRYFLIACAVFFLASSPAFAGTFTVEDQEQPTARYEGIPTQQAFVQPIPSHHRDLRTDLTVGVGQGVDLNPLLDSTHKADNYTQETLDMRFKYLLPDNPLGKLDSQFGLNILNINYYRVTDVDIFDGVVDINFNQKLSDDLTVTPGYAFETVWYPRSEPGDYFNNEFNGGFTQDLTESVYQKVLYRLQLKNYPKNKMMMGNGNRGSNLRFDIKNIFRHELGVYPGRKTKLRIINEFIDNESNYQYFDFYDYGAYRAGVALVEMFTPKFYGVASFYYMRKWYTGRVVSSGDYLQRDNLFSTYGSLMYDISKNLSIFFNYTHIENHTNETYEQYVDTLFCGGFNYTF